MRDTPIIRFVREHRGLPDNWRVYKTEAVSGWTKVRLTGSLCRPVDPDFEPQMQRDFDWIKPEQGRAQMTISREKYAEIWKDEMQ